MAWLVWNGVVVDGFEGGRLSIPSSLPRFYPARCAGKSPWQLLLLCWLPLWKRSRWTSVSCHKPPHKGGVFNVSSLSTREGGDGSSNAQEEVVLRQVREKSEFVTREPSQVAKQPNNHKTVAHIINPGKFTRFVQALPIQETIAS